MAMAIYRAFQLNRSIQEGLFYPVWASDFNFTYGAPLFAFYSPLVSYVIVGLYQFGMGWVEAAKATATLVVWLGGLGMYVYARWLFADRRAALVSATAYLFAPYFLTDIYERGAIAEALALALLPWLFWTAHHSISTDERLWLWISAALMALLMLTHNITTLFSAPVLLLYLGLLIWREKAWRRAPGIMMALGLGLSLSAFYWLPALLEREYTQVAAQMLGGIYRVDQHLTTLADLIQPQLAFDYWGPLRFHLSLWQAVLAGIAGSALVFKLLPRRYNLLLLTIILFGVMFLQLDIANIFWQTVPLARFVQFPWRLLGIAAFCCALLIGALLTWPRFKGYLGWLPVVVLLSMIFYGSLAQIAPRSDPDNPLLRNAEVSLEGLFERGSSDRALFTPFSDFLPVSVKSQPWDLPKPRPAESVRLPPMTYVPNIAVTADNPNRLALHIQATQPVTLRMHRFFFPGWVVYAAGRVFRPYPSGDLGLVTVDLPAGDYVAVVQFAQTPLRRLADIVSIVSLLVWILFGSYMHRTRSISLGLGAFLIILSALLFVQGRITFSTRQPIPYEVNFEDQISLLSYYLPSKTWHPGDNLPLRFYWLAQRVPDEDYTVFIHLITPDELNGVAQSDRSPLLGHSPTSRWEPGEIIVDEQMLHLNENIPPGTYWLLTGMYRSNPVRNLSVRKAPQVLPGDRVRLTSLEIVRR